MSERAVLFCLHGFLRSGASMWWLAHHTKCDQYAEVFTPTFGLHLHSLEFNARALHQQITSALEKHNVATLDVVTYSMGGLLIRAVLTLFPDTPIRTLVMIAPPNQGAEMADLVRRWVPIHNLGWDPLAPLLPEAPHKLVEPKESIAVGIIAGFHGNGVGYNPLLSEENDGKVCLSETKLKRSHEWVSVKGRHASLILNPTPIFLAKIFLSRQQFPE